MYIVDFAYSMTSIVSEVKKFNKFHLSQINILH